MEVVIIGIAQLVFVVVLIITRLDVSRLDRIATKNVGVHEKSYAALVDMNEIIQDLNARLRTLESARRTGDGE